MSRTIPGSLGLRELALLVGYDQRAAQYRPAGTAQLRAEIERLIASGLSRRDVAVALRLPLDDVVNAVGGQAVTP